ncbi:hypothetical protein D3C86_720130 [compost metagenome]
MYGSFASNDWVDDIDIIDGAELDYRSDYDFLVVLEKIEEKDYAIKSKIVNRTKSLHHRVSPMVRSISYVNYGLETGQFFFKEVIEKGSVLFDNGLTSFSPSRPLTLEEQRLLTNDYFNSYIKGGSRLLKLVKNSLQEFLEDEDELKELLFVVRQSFESFYSGLSLIFRGYKPKNHNLDELRGLTKVISDELNFIFSLTDDQEEIRIYSLLERSYIDARYSLNYTLDKNDLLYIISKAEKLEKIALKLSEEKVKSLK